MTEQQKCTNEMGHRWMLCVERTNRTLKITARCIWRGCEVRIEDNEIKRRLNEYETLKKATEMLSAEIEGFIVFHNKTLHPRHKEGLRAIVKYILEGK